MKILITGANGFIGQKIVSKLSQKRFKIIATDKAPTSVFPHKISYLPFTLGQENDNLFHYFHEPDVLIHLAWENLDNYQTLAHLENLPKHYYFIKNLVENGLQNLTVIGTCLEYGLLNGCLNENLPTHPVTNYGLAKDCLRKYLEALNRSYAFSFKWVRLFYLYGGNQTKKNIIGSLDKALRTNQKYFKMSRGEQLRDYLPISDVISNIISIATQKKINGIINCASGKPISIRSLVERYLKLKKKSIKLQLGYLPYLDYEPVAFWGDNTKLLKIIKNSENDD